MVAADVPAACAILNDIIARGGTTAYETAFDDAGFEEVFITGPKALRCHVVLDEDGAVAGFQWLGRNPALPEDCVDIASFTRRDPPLKGAGRALFAVTRRSAAEMGFRQINATIRADNVPGLGYYAAMGFIDHAVTPAVPLSDGTPVDRVAKRFTL